MNGWAAPSSPRSPAKAAPGQSPANLVGRLRHGRGALLDRAQGPRQPAALAGRETTILGTDLSVAALESAKLATYDARAVHLVGADERKLAFDHDPARERWTLKPEVRSLVTWKSHNLMKPVAGGPFDCIFIKNVLIYFDADSKRAVVRHLLDSLAKAATWSSAPPRGSSPCSPPGQAQDLALPETGLNQSPRIPKGSSVSGFDLADLMPYYLDETDEQIAGLSDALLKLEQAPADEVALRDGFRLVHTIKGSSMVLGFEPVKDLTHSLEAYFEALRSKKRSLDRPSLDLCFRCLDALRDYHKDLRDEPAEAPSIWRPWRASSAQIPDRSVRVIRPAPRRPPIPSQPPAQPHPSRRPRAWSLGRPSA